MKKNINKLACKAHDVTHGVQNTLANRRGEMYIDTGVKVLIGVVLGALLLTTLYVLFGDTILPNIESAIEGLSNYEGPFAQRGGTSGKEGSPRGAGQLWLPPAREGERSPG